MKIIQLLFNSITAVHMLLSGNNEDAGKVSCAT